MFEQPTSMPKKLQKGAADLCREEGGATLVEFAIIAPIMIMIFFGMVEFGEAFAVNRKISNAASTVSDLVAQAARTSDAELEDISRVAEELIKPYRTNNLRIVVSSVEADQNNKTTIGWSYAYGTGATARAQGSPIVAPAGLTEANSSVIMAETTYQFTPSMGFFLTGVITLNGEAYFRPRVSRLVIKTD